MSDMVPDIEVSKGSFWKRTVKGDEYNPPFVRFYANDNFDSTCMLSPARAREFAAALLKAANEAEGI